MSDCKIDIIKVLDGANAAVSEVFERYCFENGIVPKSVCVSAKAKGIPKYFVCNLFNDLPPAAFPCGDGEGGDTNKGNPKMKVKKPTAAKKSATVKPATAKKSAKAAKPAPKKSTAKAAKKPAKK